MGEIQEYLEAKKCKVAVDGKKYKLKATVKSLDDEEEDGSDQEQADEGEEEKSKDNGSVEMSVKILEVEPKSKYCVEFNRVDGDALVYYQIIQKLRDDLADLANA